MRFVVESWTPEYGAAIEAETLTPTEAAVHLDVESPAGSWSPIDPEASCRPAGCVHFVDGVRRIDARVWITTRDGTTRLGMCASYAAGIVRCDTAARLGHVQGRRGLFAAAGAEPIVTRAATYPPRAVAGDDPEQLSLGLQKRMGELEVQLAAAAGGADLVVVDGPLTGRQNVPGAVGYVKTHRVAYLPPTLANVVTALAPAQRTPLFVTQSSWSRYSWYLRLPGRTGHPWAGVVRCEASADLALAEARRLADTTAATLPRYASDAHKDARAPQNLYPIAALERELRRRLGDAAYLERQLRAAAAS